MFNYDNFLSRCRGRLLQAPAMGWNHSDDDMNERARMIPIDVVRKSAAVLIGIVERAEPMVLLTRRQDHLATHAGQIAFPGGRVDEGESAQEAALREAKEECGLASEFVQPLGFSDNFLTITNYVVTPLVAVVSPSCKLLAHEGEVAEIFEVPLAFLMDAENCQTQSREFKGLARHFYVYAFADRYIWGATAGMLRNLHERLYG